MELSITDLRDQPEFFETVTDRVWRAWWEPAGHTLADFTTGMRACLMASRLPFALVAHADGRYLGSTLCVAADLAERPQYTPWVAAVWVEPHARLREVGRTLVGHTRQALFRLGHRRIYLCSLPERRDFYTRQGWLPIEQDVGADKQIVYASDAGDG